MLKLFLMNNIFVLISIKIMIICDLLLCHYDDFVDIVCGWFSADLHAVKVSTNRIKVKNSFIEFCHKESVEKKILISLLLNRI